MKQVIIISAIMIVFSCKAQSVIIPLDNVTHHPDNPDYYVKDVNNEFNKFEGTWKYQNANTEITFKLKKEVHYQLSSRNEYQDLLVGEYQYIENGIEKANTLSDFMNPNIEGYAHKISGGSYTHVLPGFCEDNSPISEIKISLFVSHPIDEFVDGRAILRYVNDNGTDKLEACIYDYTTLGDSDVRLEIPNGYYVFIKQ